MIVKINNEVEALPKENMTVTTLIEWKKINPQGTAIAINNKLIKRNIWDSTIIKESDDITIITASYGG